MDLSTIIQVAIGIVFVWVAMAIVTSQIQEWISSALAWRAQMLEDTVVGMLGDKDLTAKVYEHPLIKALWTNHGQRKPAGIPEDKFALVLFEAVMNANASTAEIQDSFLRLKQNVQLLKNSENHELQNFATSMDTLLIGIEHNAENAAASITQARQRVETWFDNAMERVGGAYRRRVQIVAIIVGILAALFFNVDSVSIMNALWKDPVLRQAVVQQAQAQASQQEAQASNGQTPTQAAPTAQDIANNMNKLNALSLPIGWTFNPVNADDPRGLPTSASDWVSKVIGILITGVAAAQGAPFWFDLMRKLISRTPPPIPEKG